MINLGVILKRIVTAALLSMAFPLFPAIGQAPKLAALYQRLKAPVLPEWKSVEQEIRAQWAHSGSKAMDLLLQRGNAAMQAGDLKTAIAHFTALTDHAPQFAEGWNARATAYFLSGLYGPSIADISHVLALDPRHFGALAGLGMILEATGDRKNALIAYRRAHDIDPHNPEFRQAIKRLRAAVDGRQL